MRNDEGSQMSDYMMVQAALHGRGGGLTKILESMTTGAGRMKILE